MKIKNVASINIPSRPKISSTNPQLSKHVQITFSGRNDEFFRTAEDAFEITGQKLRQRFQKLLQEAGQASSSSSSSSNITDQIYSISRRNEDTAQICEEYRIFDNTITLALKKRLPEMAEKVGKWIDDMDKLAKENKGLKKVYGYKEIRDFLTNKFVLEDMMLDKVTGGKGKVPNALLVYGLPNNGKSLFAKALAEQSLSKLEEVTIGKLGKEAREKGISKERLAMDRIKEYGEISLRNFQDNDNQRTIILVNEAEYISKPSSPVYEEFSEFIKTCSEKYKCTLFLTTNHPTDFAKNVLSQAPYKIGIAPADRKTCKEIIHSVLNPIGKMPIEGSDILVDSFFKTPNKFYSNANIIDIINNTLNEFIGKTPLIRDYQEVIKRKDVIPSITKEDLDAFYKTKQAFEA